MGIIQDATSYWKAPKENKYSRAFAAVQANLSWLRNSSVSFTPPTQLLTSLGKTIGQMHLLDRKLPEVRTVPCSLLLYAVSYSNDVLLIKEGIISLFIKHNCRASTLSGTEDTKMSKMAFFCLRDTFSTYLNNQIYAAEEGSRCILHKFHQKEKIY